MFLKQSKSRNGRIILSLTHGYWENGKVKHKNVETFGYLDDLEKLYVDPISHFKEIAKQKTAEFNINRSVQINISSSEKLDSISSRKNLGYSILKKTYNELDLKIFFKSKQSKLNIATPTNF